MSVSVDLSPAVPAALLDSVDRRRLEATKALDPSQRSELGQFMTPPSVAGFMTSLLGRFRPSVRVLDAGAGVGSLLASFVAEACGRTTRPRAIEAVAFDVDPVLAAHLRRTVNECRKECARLGIEFSAEVKEGDFIREAVEQLDVGLFRPDAARSFTHAVLNPPYKKLPSASPARAALRRVGIETSNLYTAFLALAILLLEPGGELVAITPRSFCNGPYFRPFREMFFGSMSLRRIHVFESRTAAFGSDDVLQENVILHAVKEVGKRDVIVSSSNGPGKEMSSIRTVPFSSVVRPGDPELFIHIVPRDAGQGIADALTRLPATLSDLDLAVSTGKVVDFRAREYLRQEPDGSTCPLIYPTHLASGVVQWPRAGKKPNGLVDVAETANLWVPTGTYALVKRFSSKEERRRVVASVFHPEMAPGDKIGFENHINVFHRKGQGIPPVMARGLAAFLNSTLVDTYFRQFNGHTQVNATDLRNLRYPTLGALEQLGRRVPDPGLPQREIDTIVEDVLGLTGVAYE